MIPDITAQRQAIEDLLGDLTPPLPIYTAAPTGTLPKQFLVVGMPAWVPPSQALCMHQVTWQVMVAVRRDGTNDQATAQSLEDLWPQLLRVLIVAVETDPSLGGVCATSAVTRAEFAPVTISGQEFPAQVITLEMQGA